jgi:hypothetical protein
LTNIIERAEGAHESTCHIPIGEGSNYYFR